MKLLRISLVAATLAAGLTACDATRLTAPRAAAMDASTVPPPPLPPPPPPPPVAVGDQVMGSGG